MAATGKRIGDAGHADVGGDDDGGGRRSAGDHRPGSRPRHRPAVPGPLPSLVRLAYLLTSDGALAEELAQEAFVVVWRAWDRPRSTEEVVGYLRGTVVNLARMSLRRRLLEARHRLAPERAQGAGDPTGRLDLERAIGRLPLRKRSCIVLRYFADLSEEETARVLGVSVGTVKASTHRALRDLERHLKAGADDLAPRPGQLKGSRDGAT
jgi:RNA polymerase sigma-70 factor (sigma-E family)